MQTNKTGATHKTHIHKAYVTNASTRRIWRHPNKRATTFQYYPESDERFMFSWDDLACSLFQLQYTRIRFCENVRLQPQGLMCRDSCVKSSDMASAVSINTGIRQTVVEATAAI